MRKFYLLFMFVLLLAPDVFSQQDSVRIAGLEQKLITVHRSLIALDTTFTGYFIADTNGRMSTFLYNSYLNPTFTNLTYQRGVLPSGNSASINLLEDETQLSLSLARPFHKKNGRITGILTAGVKANLGEGVATLFQKNEFTSGTTFFADFAYLIPTPKHYKFSRFKTKLSVYKNGKKTQVPFDVVVQNAQLHINEFRLYTQSFAANQQILLNRLKEINKHLQDSSLGRNDCCNGWAKEHAELIRQQDSITLLIQNTEAKRKVLERSLRKNGWVNPTDTFPEDSLLVKARSVETIIKSRLAQLERLLCECPGNDTKLKAALLAEKEDIEKQINKNGFIDKTAEEFEEEVADRFKSRYYELFTKDPVWQYVKLFWVNGGLIYTRKAYATYDSSLSLTDRIDEKPFDSYGLKFAGNYYLEKFGEKGMIRSVYVNLSYEPKLISSYDNLTDITVSKAIQIVTSGDTTFSFKGDHKVKDISGKAFSTTWQHNIGGAVTLMFFEKKNIGINLIGKSQISSLSKTIWNARGGLIISMKNNTYDASDKSSKAKVNFEIFLSFSDITNVADNTQSVWERKVIGVSTNIPFNHIFLK